VAIDRLTGLDRLMLGASRRWPQDIGALAVLDGGPLLDATGHLELERIRRSIDARLHLVPRFRQRIFTPRRGLGGPLWVDDRGFDLSQHVREHPVRPPAGEAELIDAVEQLRRRPLDPSRPMWDMSFLTGLPDQRIALLVRIHHTIADGMAAMLTLAAILDSDPDTPITAPLPWTPAPAPTARELLTDNVLRRVASLTDALSLLLHPLSTGRQVRLAWPAIRELLAEQPATPTSLDRMVGPNRNLALIRTALEAVKEGAHTQNATVNDVLLTATTAGLRTVLGGRGEPVDDTMVRIYVPVSLRDRRSGPQQGNSIAQMAVPLPLGEPDPVRRLRWIAAETAKRKARMRISLGVLMHGRTVRRLLLMAVMRQRVNATTASIPGPPMPLYLAGAPILEVFPLLPLIANEPLGIGAISYAGGLYIGITVDPDVFPDLDVFAAAVRDDLRALQSPQPAPLASATEPTFERTTT
jgi:diacylglycerol O-acyltransferase / wax synthase